MSGNVFDPRAIEELFPGEDWKEELMESQSSVATPVADDQFLVLTEESSFKIPNLVLPKQLHNEGNFIISLGQVSVSLNETWFEPMYRHSKTFNIEKVMQMAWHKSGRNGSRNISWICC